MGPLLFKRFQLTRGVNMLHYDEISKQHIEYSHESATTYLFLAVPYNDGERPSDKEVQDNFYEEFETRICSEYDCTGRWFTGDIIAKVVDDNTWDNELTVAVIISWGRDI